MRKNRYVVGFYGERQHVVYGKDSEERFSYTHSMTRRQAKRQLKKLTGKPKAIFELVPCEVEQ